jgi:quercetin dioxygenase-like cupin family protein
MTQTAPNNPAPRSMSVHRGQELQFAENPSEPGQGVRVAPFLTPEHGATNLSVAVVELQPGAQVPGHRHPFEESFFVLEGAPLVAVADKRYALKKHDFGLVPFAAGHAWSNPTDTPARFLRVHAPQPRPIGGRGLAGVFSAPETAVPVDGVPVDELDPVKPFAGHFDQSDMAPPGSISMPGYHGANIQNVQIRMMVDDLLGARHHTMFIVQFTPNPSVIPRTAKEHFHPFDEVYYLLSGETQTFCDGEINRAGAGDLIFAPVAASHGFTPISAEPVCWVELQSPLPPASDAFTFHNDWEAHTNIG